MMADGDAKLNKRPVALTIAGSDSCGGAGIQADLRTFEALNVHGVSAVTCVTAQNDAVVNAVEPVSPSMVSLQVKTVCDEYNVSAAKTGMLYNAALVELVVSLVKECGLKNLVVDPIMVSSSGVSLIEDDALDLMCKALLPLATVITPNVPEAEFLLGCKIRSLDEVKEAAQVLSERYGVASVVKGGHLVDLENDVVDVLWFNGEAHEYALPRIDCRPVHGTGCLFSAAIAAKLASGAKLVKAVELAKDYVRQVMEVV